MYVTEYKSAEGMVEILQSFKYSVPEKVLGDFITVLKPTRNALGQYVDNYEYYQITEIRQYYDKMLTDMHKLNGAFECMRLRQADNG